MAWLNGVCAARANHGSQTRAVRAQILMVMQQLANAATNRRESISWPTIEEQACKSMPPCTPWIRALSVYVAMNAGGANGQLLTELAQFAKAFGSGGKGPSRILGSEFPSKLANLNFGAGQRYPYLLDACIETQLVSPPNQNHRRRLPLTHPDVAG